MTIGGYICFRPPALTRSVTVTSSGGNVRPAQLEVLKARLSYVRVSSWKVQAVGWIGWSLGESEPQENALPLLEHSTHSVISA